MTSEVTKLILMWMVIIAFGIIVFWLGTSAYANFTENKVDTGLPDFPNIKKAQYLVTFKATGNVILTNDYVTETRDVNNEYDDLHVLNGYYEIKGNKYKFRDTVLLLDELYFGDIKIQRRSE